MFLRVLTWYLTRRAGPGIGTKYKKSRIRGTQKLKNVQRYAKISDTPFDQRCLIHPELWLPGGPRIPKNPIFFKQKKSSKTQKLKNVQRYAKISNTTFDQRSLIYREAWFPGGPRIPQNPYFFEKHKKSYKTQKLKNVQRYAKISDTPFDQRSLIHRETWFSPCFVGQNQQKKLFFARRFLTIFKPKCSNVRPLLFITFPQEFKISKNIGHPTSGSGGKKTFKLYLKIEQTDKHTDRQTDGHFDLQKASAQRADALKSNF